MATFTATLLQSGKTATGIEVPPAVVEELGIATCVEMVSA